MLIEYSASQRALQSELREYMSGIMTPELEAELAITEGGGPEYSKALRKLGADGWLGIGWPKEYGGQGRSAVEQFIFSDEVQRVLFPLPSLTLNTVGPALMTFGTDAQRQEYLPKILRGEVHFSIGYSEPEAGTDLASLRTTAVRDGDQWVINGQKVFTSLVEWADYVWLAARTDPEAKKHKGISIFIVDTKSEGFTMAPTRTIGDNACATTYYENVRVDSSMMVGEPGGGWKLITTQLNHERVTLMTVGLLQRMVDETTAWAHRTGRLEVGWVRMNLAEIHAKVDVLKLLNWRQAWKMGSAHLGPAEASTVKVFGSELYMEAYKKLLEVVGSPGCLRAGSPGAVLRGRLERMYRALMVLTFGGGTNEIQRDIIAQAGLRMPRPGM